jgi:hypothetical protein
MTMRVELDPPVDAGIRCCHCYGTIVAIAEITDGFHWYVWSHSDGKRECRPVQHAEPHSGYEAIQAVRQKIKELAATKNDPER